MKVAEIRELSEEEIKEKLMQLRTELAKERTTIASGTRPEKPAKVRQLRRDIARMLTILREKELEKTKKRGD
jgi:large subunit ribosomal protein L29